MVKRQCSLYVVSCAMAILGTAVACLAQGEAESIYIANTKVITIRDKGPYSSVKARAVAIDKAITDIISKQDTQHPSVTVKEAGGLWTVYCGDIKVTSVFPAEAKANDLQPKALAAVWAKALKQTLPRATPASKLPASAFQPKPGAPVAPVAVKPPVKPAASDVPTEVSTGDTPPAVEPRVAAPVAPVPVAPTEKSAPLVSATAIGAPTLLVRDAFNTARALSEEEYGAKREELVNHLINDLTPFITGKVATVAGPTDVTRPGRREPTAAVVKPLPAVKPATVKPGTTKPATVKPGTTKPATVKPGTGGPAPAGVDLPKPQPENPSYAKVPQKKRIRMKLERSREPFLALRGEDPTAAKTVGDLLSSCRSAFARGDFEKSEQDVDEALKLLGTQ